MNPLRAILAIAAFVSASVLPLSAAQELLTVEESVKIALRENPSQVAAHQAVAAAEAVVARTRADRRPAVDVVGSARQFETHAFLPSDLALPNASATIGPTDDWALGVEGRMSLYDSGRNRARVREAIATQGSVEHDAMKARANLALAVHRAFRRLEAAMASRDAAQSRVARSADHLRLAQSRVDAGASPPADVTRANVEDANARAALAAAEAEVKIAAAVLNTLLGRNADQAIAITRAEPPERTATLDLVDSSIRSALERHPEVLAARRRLAGKKAAISVAAATSGLTADLRARYGVRDDEFLPSDRDYSVGVTVSKSVFDGGRRKAEVARARAEARAEEARVAMLENELRREVVEAHARFEEAMAQAEAAEAARLEAGESVRLTRSRYDAGAAPIGDLLDAASELDAAEAADVRARMNVHVAIASLAHVRGELVPSAVGNSEEKQEGE